MGSAALVPVLNPETGKVHMIPTNQVDQARAAGGKPVAQMRDPKGTMRYVPMDMVQEAQKNGGTLIPYGSQTSEQVAQDKTGIHPYENPVAAGLAGVGRAIASPVTGAYGLYRAISDGPDKNNPEEVAAQNAHGAAGLAYQKLVKEPAEAAQKTSEGLAQTGHPIAAQAAKLGAIPILGAGGQNLGNRVAAGDLTGALTEGVTSALLPKAMKEGLSAAGPALGSAGEGIINKGVVGARDADFARDANLGRGYLKNKLGTSASMQSIADKSGEALDEVGKQIGDSIDQSAQAGKLIPANTIRKAIHPIIDKARNETTAPGVVADPAQFDQLKESFELPLKNAWLNGGISPRELWDIRHTMNKSLNWADQSRANLTRTQQQVSGALGGIIEDQVPGLDELNENYKDLVKLHGRASKRAATGQGTITGVAGKLASMAGGALVGGTTPEGAALGAAGGAIMDSIPVKTALATGLNKVSTLGPKAGAATLAGALAPEAGNAVVGDKDDGNPSENPESPHSATPAQESTPEAAETPTAPKGKPLDLTTAIEYYDQANGDPDAAREMAVKDGYQP